MKMICSTSTAPATKTHWIFFAAVSHSMSVCSRALAPHACVDFGRRFIIFKQLLVGFDSDKEAHAHGSILMVGAILEHGGYFMMPRFDETCVAVMGLKDKHSL